MKKLEEILGMVMVIIVILAGGLYILSHVDTNNRGIDLGGYTNFNIFEDATHTATTTGATTMPVLLLSRNTARQYARIDNNSATEVFLFYATSTAGMIDNKANALNGIVIEANTSYEIFERNLYTGIVYASSTAAALAINVTEK